MNVVLLALLGAAALTAGVFAWMARRASVSARKAAARADELSRQLTDSAAQLEGSEQQRRAADVRAAAAEARRQDAEQKAADAERKAGDAERRVGHLMRGADAGPVWELERLRADREWLDLVGPGVPLPSPWGGDLISVVATELAIIREVVGTPGRLSVGPAAPRPVGPIATAVAARAVVELLRALARSGEEMEVTVGGSEVTVAQPVTAGETPPDVTALAHTLQEAGLTLTMLEGNGRSVARLLFSPPSET